jgi:Tfp pilus assembly protein PilN
MRPVNLIPPEDRRGDRAPARTGVLPYVLVGGLVAALAAVSAVVLTSNQISDREAELAGLEAQEATATARAEALAPYAEFASMAEARDATVDSLARSRFDWERVLRELAFVMPDDVWLVKATGTVSPDVQLEDVADVSIRSDVAGPAVALIGCGRSQESVAAFAAALRDIDGVTRTTVNLSERPESQTTSTDGSSEDCRTRDFISRFEIVAAFDEVPVPATAAAPAAPTTPEASPPAEVADAQTQEQAARDATTEQVGDAQEAANLVPGVTTP